MNLVLGRKSFQVSETLTKMSRHADNKNEEGESNQKTELKINTGKAMLLVEHMAFIFIYACISHILYIVDSEFN